MGAEAVLACDCCSCCSCSRCLVVVSLCRAVEWVLRQYWLVIVVVVVVVVVV